MMLTGTYRRNLDEKRRISLPKPIRQWARRPATIHEGIYLTPGTEKCLQLHTDESLGHLMERLRHQSPGRDSVRAFSRIFHAQAELCEIDAQGRICIPIRLLKWAKLEKEIVLIGVGWHVELWCEFRWRDYLDQRQPEFDSLVSLAFGDVSDGRQAAETEAIDITTVKPK